MERGGWRAVAEEERILGSLPGDQAGAWLKGLAALQVPIPADLWLL
jgi:hypothetical protein